ncbi:MAG TPA: lipid-binding SYLF domain-containing protein [Terriglobia bacterium]|nr:lipid-binding SYLF domain-containing protein [Terriglobia bacterium]
MKRVSLILLLFAFCVSAFARESQLQKATNVINEIMATPENGVPQDLLNKAVCVGIIPSEIKGALVIGGSYGRGVLVCRDNGTGPWGAPSMFTIGSGSVGFQIGGKATDVVFIVMDGEGARKLVQDSVKLGAELSVAAGPVGRSAEGATDAQLHAEILSYSRSRGLFAGASLDGTVVKQDWDDNQQLYGHKVSAKQILFGGHEAVPADARGLDDTLAKYSPKGGQQFSQAMQSVGSTPSEE